MPLLSDTRLEMLRRVKETSVWNQCRMLVYDTGGLFLQNYGTVIDLITNDTAPLSLVFMYNTKLDKMTSRMDTMWPNYRMIRNDDIGDGILLQFHYMLKVEEMMELPKDVAGLWVLLRGGIVEGKEKVSLFGFVVVKEKDEKILEYVTTCLKQVENKFGSEVDFIVYINRDLNSVFSSHPIPASSLTRSSPGTSVLHSSPGPLSRPVCQGGTLFTTLTTGCSLCARGFLSEEELASHRKTAKHKKNFFYKYYQDNKADLLNNPHTLGLSLSIVSADQGIKVSRDEGLVEVRSNPGEVKVFKLQLKNELSLEDSGTNEDLSGIVVETVGISRGEEVIKLTDEHNLTTEDETKIRIRPGKRYKVTVTCSSRQVGQYRVPVIAAFYHESNSKREGEEYRLSHIAMEFLVKVQTEEIVSMQPVAQFCPPPKFAPWFVYETVKGKAPAMLEVEDNLMVKMPLGNYPLYETRARLIATKMQGAGDTKEEMDELVKCRALLEKNLSEENYTARWELLLHCEQWQEERDIRYFDMVGVTLKMERNSGLVVLEIPGLQENRPSVLRGDKLFVRETGKGLKEYEGIVHTVGEQVVWLGFSDKLIPRLKVGMLWDVRFSVSTFPISNMHRAVKLAQSLSLTKSIFPSSNFPPPLLTPDLQFFDKNVETNPEQLSAVQAIVTAKSGVAPYLVFGPPGTGKTVTLVEAIKQVWKLSTNTHIIATAPSNTAADLLATRLAKDIPTVDMLRLHASSRSRETVPDSLRPVSNLTDAGYVFPPMTQLAKYRILITTLVTAGKLVSAMFPPNHFQHVFIDEAAQATEPETMVALAGIISPNISYQSVAASQIVMAGDPKQLGPIVRSVIADNNGMSISLMERLMANPPYSNTSNGYDKRCITKLTRNFRSHAALLALPARLFYSNELIPCGDKSMVESCLQFPGLTEAGRGKTPLIVHGVIGQDLREQSSPSFFNPEEVVTVMDYVDQVLAMPGMMEEDIGVITPYRRQVQKIRGRLVEKNRRGVTVGTTEEFQGQERKVIILSTVRSSPEYVHIDNQYRLGFLADPKRFNVAITRAQALLIVVGNPRILIQDKDWRELLEYARSVECYTGCAYPKEGDAEMDIATNKFAKLMIDQVDMAMVEERGWAPSY